MQVQEIRGSYVETVHPVCAVAVRLGQDRELLALRSVGAPFPSAWRSAGKPIQLHTCLRLLGEADPATAQSLGAEDLALGASSHSGQPEHLARLRALMARFGLGQADLYCGAEPPMNADARAALGTSPALNLHNDCAGKHAYMAAVCRAHGWPGDYRPAAHPLQQVILGQVRAWTGHEPGIAVDGCGVPTFHLPISGMATAWARLACHMAHPTDDPLAARIGAAMAAHPFLTSGSGRLDLQLASRAAERWVGKVGARGVFCIALPDRRMGVAFKVHTGDIDALAVAIPIILDQLAPGALHPDPKWPWAVVRNVVGAVVGRRVVTPSSGA